jgi:hypothetical protein
MRRNFARPPHEWLFVAGDSPLALDGHFWPILSCPDAFGSRSPVTKYADRWPRLKNFVHLKIKRGIAHLYISESRA